MRFFTSLSKPFWNFGADRCCNRLANEDAAGRGGDFDHDAGLFVSRTDCKLSVLSDPNRGDEGTGYKEIDFFCIQLAARESIEAIA